MLLRYAYASEADAVAAQRDVLEEQLGLLAGTSVDLPADPPKQKRQRVLEKLGQIAAVGGVLGDLATRAANDLREVVATDEAAGEPEEGRAA